ncbi:putative pentatricopeptide repeat-containing protein [Glycine soja]
MLLFARNIGSRASLRVSSFHSSPLQNPFPLFFTPSSLSSQNSIFARPMIWFASFLCVMRYPFVSKPSFDDIASESMRSFLQQDRPHLFDSALVPIWVSKDLLNLKGDPKSALKFFKEAGARAGFRHAAESYCVLAHILFCGMFYLDARSVIKEWILLGREFPGCDFFDMLWSTRNVCRPGFGVFDTLFSVLVDLGMLEEAKAMLLKKNKFMVLPKVRSCNDLLHRLSKSSKGELALSLFKDMVVAGLSPSVFTYNIVIGCLAREGDIETARSLFEEMKALGLRPDIVTYNPLIYGYGKVGMLTGAVTVFEEMKDAGCEPDVITYNSLINLKEFLKLLSICMR